MTKKLIILGLSLALLLSIPLLTNYSTSNKRINSSSAIEWLQHPKSIDAFELKSTNGDFTKVNLLNHWTIMVFGYTRCPDVCPTSLNDLTHLADELEQHEIGAKFNYVFVSVDPEQDSLENIALYLNYFRADFIGVTGNISSLKTFSQSVGVRFASIDIAGSNNISHSVYFLLIGPDGKLHARFEPNFDTQKTANELIKLP
ncbi:SCO family protein [Thalassotalea marina]|uniref:Copper-binding protein n=1 Tax=Thalassotalea marina TaxID=1673741 RepID=A0A919BII4_9GAMM|nr:SCO family protein [Thalassotalea marina]GHF94143.1 copper-binding protein [Thalassotalea marina]